VRREFLAPEMYRAETPADAGEAVPKLQFLKAKLRLASFPDLIGTNGPLTGFSKSSCPKPTGFWNKLR
jgi:hypothetical protein